MLKATMTIWLWITFMRGYTQDLSYKQFTTADGLSSNVVYTAFQDTLGYMWFCTDAGVSRFDGVRFRNYTVKDGLSDNEVFNAVRMPSGNILFITFNAKPCYYDHSDGTIHNEQTDPWLHEQFPGALALYKDTRGRLWAQDKFNAIYVLDEQQRHIQKFPAVFNDSLVVITTQSIDTISLAENTAIARKASHLKHTRQRDIEALPDIRAYIVFCKNYVNKISKVHPAVPLHYLYEVFTKTNAPKFRYLEFSYPQVNSRTWFSHGNNGIVSYADLFDVREQPIVYLPKKNISYFFVDKEGNYWFTSNNEGVFLLTATARAVKNYCAEPDKPEVYSVTGNDRYIVAGRNNEVLVLNRSSDGKFTLKLNNIAPGTIYNRVKDLLLADDKLWVATDIGGLRFRFSETGTFSNHTLREPEFYNSALKCLARGAGGVVYIGTYSNIMVSGPQGLHNLLQKRITAVAETSPAQLLLGSVDGLYTYKDGTAQRFDEHKIFHSSVTDIEKVNDSLVCVATNGVGVIMLSGKQFFLISAADSLPAHQQLSSDICRKIFVDRSGNIWVGTNQGLSMIRFTSQPQEYVVQHFTTDDGLLSNDVNDVYVSGDTVWVATMTGLNMFKYGQVKRSGSFPLIYISNRDSLHNQSFAFRSPVAIGLQGISYESLGKVRYVYQLKGLNTTWQTTNRHEIYYEVLPPGNYELQVYAVNRFGQKSEKPAHAAFTILPPWWQTNWAYFSYCIAVVATFSGTIFLVKRNLRRKEKARMKHRKQLQRLELKALRSQMNPHFIFNTLNAIQKYILENDADLSYRYLSKFSRLIRTFLENSRRTTITLQQELDLLQSYMEMEALRFRNKFTYEVQLDQAINPTMIAIPSMLIQPYVENAIWHGIQHKSGNGAVKISIHHLEAGIFKCCIEDNGIGRKKAREIAGQSYASHQPVGMIITQQRLKLINQKLKDRLSVNFIDLEDSSSGKECGTRVELLITYSTKQYDSIKSSDY